MKVIHKKGLNIVDRQHILLPGFESFVTLKDQDGSACVWYEADTDRIAAGSGVAVDIEIIGTGIEVSSIPNEYLGTIVSGSFVWHFYHSALEHYSE